MSQGPIVPTVPAERPIDPGVRVGHVHLRTAGIDRVRDFYVGVLGFDVVMEARDVPGWGTTGDILFLSAGGYDLELAWDRPFEEWPRDEHGHVAMAMDDAVDLEALVAAAG